MAELLHRLQRSAGNQAVNAFLRHDGEQPVARHAPGGGAAVQRQNNAPEAEEETPLRGPETLVSRTAQPKERAEYPLQKKAEVGREGGLLSPRLAERIQSKRGSGAALDEGTRTQMESAFGTDFAAVSIHTDGESDALNRSVNAVAFTTGNDIFFSQSTYRPQTAGGTQLLAHELTHVVQQRSFGGSEPMRVGPANDSHEQEADAVSAAVARANVDRIGVARYPALQRKGNPSAAQAAALRARAAAASDTIRAAHGTVTDTVGQVLTSTDKVKEQLLGACKLYDDAYTGVAEIIKQANETLKFEDSVVDVLMGIVIGVGVGMGVGALAEGIGVATAAGKVAWEATGEALEAATAWGVGKVSGSASRRDASDAAAASPGGTSPTAMKLEAYQKLAASYRAAAAVSLEAAPLNDAQHWADLVTGEAKVYEGGGTGERSMDEIEAAVKALEGVAAKTAAVTAALQKVTAEATALEAAGSKAAAADQDTFERQIWIEWMGGLSNDAANRLLDVDAIENRLREKGIISGDGKAGRLGVDFGNWTSDADTEQARDEADRARRDDYADAFGPQQVGKTVTVSASFVSGPVSVSIPGTRWDWAVTYQETRDDQASHTPPQAGESVVVRGYNQGARRLLVGPVS